MDILDRLLPPSWSFRKQLLYTVSLGVACMALLASLATAVLQSMSMRESLVREGVQITDNFATQSVLALLLSSQENAADSAKATLAFPNVRHVSIYNMEHGLLLKQGETVDWAPAPEVMTETAPPNKASLL